MKPTKVGIAPITKVVGPGMMSRERIIRNSFDVERESRLFQRQFSVLVTTTGGSLSSENSRVFRLLLPGLPVPTTPQILPHQIHLCQQHLMILLPDPPVPTTPQILLPDPPKQTTPQILLPDPPVVKTLEPTFTDDYSMDQILSSVFGDYLQQGIPLAHTQEPQVLDTVPSLFDESNDLISFLDNFEAGLALEQQETPMDLTMPRMKKKVINTIGFKVIEPLNLSIRNCLPFIHLDLTWDKGVELRFFQVGRPHSHRVWEAYQPQTTDAYRLDLTNCRRVADVYEMVDVVGRLGNASTRSCSLAHGGSPTLKRAWNNTSSARTKGFGPWNALTSRPRPYIKKPLESFCCLKQICLY
ncbi:hypothetical protein TNCV_3569431 [Trichonephila clavipes]|nr:hypothetical protein TNCV_3569431 [Trichonephila clavipes]